MKNIILFFRRFLCLVRFNKPRIGAGGCSSYPPTISHIELLQRMVNSGYFEIVYLILTGERPDKHFFINPTHRQKMMEIAQKKIHCPFGVKLIVIYEDVDRQNTPTYQWLKTLEQWHPGSYLAWYTGSDSISLGTDGQCDIIRFWNHGDLLAAEYDFYVVERPQFPSPPPDHPAITKFKRIIRLPTLNFNTSSTEIRTSIMRYQPWQHLTDPEIVQYILDKNVFAQSNQ